MLNKYANDIVTEDADKKHIGKVFARLPSLNNDGKMVDFLMGYDENGVFILPTKELTSEAADIASRKRITESAADVAAPKKSSMVMFGQRKATYHQENQPPSEPK